MSAQPDPRFTNNSILNALPRAGETSARVPSTLLRAGAPAVPKPEAKKKKFPGGLLVAVVIGGLFCVALTVVLVLTSSPAVASMLQPAPQVTSTRVSYFIQSDLRMPTLTPTPTVTPSPTPTETPAYVEMSIVQDTATPERTYSYQSQSSSSYAGNKYILVDISEQHVYVYEGDALIWSWVASTGMNNATRTGVFAVQSKIPNAYGATWNIWMPNWLGIYWAGGLENGIHALPILPGGARLWAGFLGRPVSYGCVVLGEYESGLLYNWAEIGTPVEIQW